MIDLLSLTEAAEKAIEGPWAYQEESDAYTHIVRQGVHPNVHGWVCSAGQSSSKQTEDTARFIAAASPETILALCSELSAARERIAKLEELLRRYRYFKPSTCSKENCVVLACIERKDMERVFALLESEKAAK